MLKSFSDQIKINKPFATDVFLIINRILFMAHYRKINFYIF